MKKVLVVWGGWQGHTPKETAELFARRLADVGFSVDLRDSLAVYTDADYMSSLDLIVPVYTASRGTIDPEQWRGLSSAVRSGVGCGGWHGFIDSFRPLTEYHWMTGGQWVAHPGNCIPRYTVNIADADHEITRGIGDFEMLDTEQYYCHTDPANHVLATTTFSGEHGDSEVYRAGTVMPYAWIKSWGKGRVFVASWGHTFKDFDVPEALEITMRGLQWACR